jgi:beta-glucanase (GH16 family)
MSHASRTRARLLAGLSLGLLAFCLSPINPPGAVAAKDPCGPSVRKSTGGKWVCTMADDFTGTSVNSSKWVPATTASTGVTYGECFVDSPNNIRVSDGTLKLTVRKEAEPFVCKNPNGDFTTQYTSGWLTGWSKFSQTYGRFEIRAAFPAAKTAGLHSALWLWPVDPNKYGSWPASGEIDIAEFYTAYPDRVIPYVHYEGDALDPNATNNYCFVERPEDFHTYVVEWTPQTITVLYDGKACIVDDWKPTTLTKPAPFDHPFFLNLTQALGSYGNKYDESTTPLPATMTIDRVRVWK